MTFVTQPFIGQELFEHVSSSYEGFENCAQCGRKFDNQRELKGHILWVHEKGIQMSYWGFMLQLWCSHRRYNGLLF